MKPKLDDSFLPLIVCPLCKTSLVWLDDKCFCDSCGQQFSRSASNVWSFMLNYPRFLSPRVKWAEGQREYEAWNEEQKQEDNYDMYMSEIDSVREIYSIEFNLSGLILDVGGHQGRLRHFLPRDTAYLSIDPYALVFDSLDPQTNLLRAYPCLHEPCNFLQAQAEYLPLKTSSFDYVHLRSVLDHLFDPYTALLEARRVLNTGGGLMIGIYTTKNVSSSLSRMVFKIRRKFQREGWQATFKAVIRRAVGKVQRDTHIWHPTYPELIELLNFTHFRIEKIIWQKPPFNDVVYLMARK
jgi:SAM-dependent methyltransferase